MVNERSNEQSGRPVLARIVSLNTPFNDAVSDFLKNFIFQLSYHSLDPCQSL
jgi:hypothetical protein